jgi:Zinc finger, C2H2 type
MQHMATNISPISPNKFVCNYCSITCCRQTEWNRHIETKKHKGNISGENSNVLATTVTPFSCEECGKKYTDRTGLWRHKKKCKTKTDLSTDNLVIELIKQNQEFQTLLLDQNNKMLETFQEVCKNGIVNNSNNSAVNSHNKTFNLQVFLNEDCKDAMNVTQFIDSFDLQLIDFENVGKMGFVNGISDIIIKKLKSLDENERPIHCTDQKRQVLYAKVIDAWEKEGDDNKILRRIIKCVAFKNSKNIQLFRDKYPDCMNWDSKHADRYQILRIESLGGLGNEDVDNENKIIRKIAREILIDKSL